LAGRYAPVKAVALLALLAALAAAQALAEPPAGPPEEPVSLPELPEPDPSLFAPLEPLGSMTRAPVTDRVPDRPAETALPYRVTLTGLGGTGTETLYRELSTLSRGTRDPVTPGELASRIRTDVALIRQLLADEGWLSPTIDTQTTPDPARTTVAIKVDPGRRYVWGTIMLDALPPDRPDLAEGFALEPGEPMRLSQVEPAEAELRLRLNDAGFPFADLGPRDIEVDDATATGDYLLTGLVGGPAVFGAIVVPEDFPLPANHVAHIARFSEGDPWSGLLFEDFRRALIATRLISNTSVTAVDTGLTDAEGRPIANLVVAGAAAPRRTLIAQGGYSTDEGIRVEGRFQNRNFFPPEGTLTLRGVVGTLEQRAGVEVRKSNFGKRDRFFLSGGEFANEDRPAFEATSFRVGVAAGRESTPIWQKRWVWQAGAELISTDERSKAELRPRERYLIGALPASGGYDGSNDLLDPTRGFRVGLRFSPEAALQGGETRGYLRMQLDSSAYVTPSGPLTIAARGRLGSIIGTDTLDIAPSRRLYAGGGGSVRGYSFQGLGPQEIGFDGERRPTGGRGLTEASVEARYRFGDFGIVAFVDAGQLVDEPRPRIDAMRFGAGLGARYFTSFGPIRLDIARAIDKRPEDPDVVLYISIGQAF
jgi:translocation and assembly module TamA